ncbi:uncharacterized protein LOC106447271 isoform X1 [Brassica napus]|uniref:uncharacterized protein LOC106447271 isoform X1 n=1 Tax=Brassica napus TaxID=3708 RepID=UPI00207A2BC5|nr:uncharacterized protein LOC106447271 isoform X1 [Brassica napus]XP_048614169.1 uncharacterized protein LOC106447271 isoform X1 [Brassica napus]
MAAPHFTQIETTASSLNPLMYSFLFSCLLSLSLFSFISATYFLLKASRRRAAISNHKLSSESETKLEPSEISESAHYQTGEDDETRCAKSRLYELLLCDKKSEEESDWDGDEGVSAKKKKRKRRGKKKKKSEVRGGGNDESGGDGLVPKLETKPEFVCLYPFTSSSSATQRKIKQQYDHLVKCNSAKGLTLAQVGEFANCLIEAKNELQNKSEVIKRKYSITKALLFKADRSSFDRLRQQIYKLEMEQKRVQEDALVYNWLQQQLKLSPAYKKVLEISASMELKDKTSTELDSQDDEVSDISFEELLEQEKKDSFWHKNGRLRTCSRT